MRHKSESFTKQTFGLDDTKAESKAAAYGNPLCGFFALKIGNSGFSDFKSA